MLRLRRQAVPVGDLVGSPGGAAGVSPPRWRSGSRTRSCRPSAGPTPRSHPPRRRGRPAARPSVSAILSALYGGERTATRFLLTGLEGRPSPARPADRRSNVSDGPRSRGRSDASPRGERSAAGASPLPVGDGESSVTYSRTSVNHGASGSLDPASKNVTARRRASVGIRSG